MATWISDRNIFGKAIKPLRTHPLIGATNLLLT